MAQRDGVVVQTARLRERVAGGIFDVVLEVQLGASVLDGERTELLGDAFAFEPLQPLGHRLASEHGPHRPPRHEPARRSRPYGGRPHGSRVPASRRDRAASDVTPAPPAPISAEARYHEGPLAEKGFLTP